MACLPSDAALVASSLPRRALRTSPPAKPHVRIGPAHRALRPLADFRMPRKLNSKKTNRMAPSNDESNLPGRMSAIERFLQNLLAERPTRRRSPGVAGYLCKKGVGEPDALDPRWIVYRPEHFIQAEALLRDAALPTTAPPKRPPERKPRPRATTTRPDLDRVAVFPSGQSWPREVLYAVMKAADAARLQHDVILLCQDLNALHLARRTPWVVSYIGNRRALMLFRGGVANSGFAVRASAALIQRSQAPVLALVDLDAKGLTVAARLPRLEAICVPSWDEVERHTGHSTERGPQRVNRLLDGATHRDVKRAWAVIRSLPSGIPVSAGSLEAGPSEPA